jgi:hypothetical protein
LHARLTLVPLAAAAALALSACGDDDTSSETEAEQAKPASALLEAGKTRASLALALATYKAGDKAKAADQASEAYLQHFELVEGPLEAKDEELTEELEDAIREELVGKMKARAPVKEVEALAKEIDRDLATAEAKLK